MAVPRADAVLSPEELAEVGRILYGERWQTELGRALGRPPRGIRFLASGHSPVNAAIARQILDIVRKKQHELVELAAMLTEKVQS